MTQCNGCNGIITPEKEPIFLERLSLNICKHCYNEIYQFYNNNFSHQDILYLLFQEWLYSTRNPENLNENYTFVDFVTFVWPNTYPCTNCNKRVIDFFQGEDFTCLDCIEFRKIPRKLLRLK